MNNGLGNIDPTEDGLLLWLSLGPENDGILIRLEDLDLVLSRPETLGPERDEVLCLDLVSPRLENFNPAKDEVLVRLENVLANEVLHVGGINGAPVVRGTESRPGS